MESIDVTDLSRHADSIIREIQQQQNTIGITCEGEVIAYISPAVGSQYKKRDDWEEVWKEITELAAEIGRRSTGPVSAVELVREGRRDLGNVRD